MSMRAQILTVAEELIRTDGLAHATTRSIAAHAGCSEGTIYRHFKSKDEILLTVLAERMPEFLPIMHDIFDQAGKGNLSSQLTAIMKSALAFYKVLIPVIAATFAEPPLLNQYRMWMHGNNSAPHRAVELLAEYISREQALGRINQHISPLAAAEILLGSCYLRAYSRQFAAVTPTSDNKFISDTISVLFRGMRPSPGEARMAAAAAP
jgi:AcrR family transcriptional regulator